MGDRARIASAAALTTVAGHLALAAADRDQERSMTTPTPPVGDPSQLPPAWTAPAPPPTPPKEPGWPAQSGCSGGQPGGPAQGGWADGWQQPASPPPGRNGMAVAALVLGIIPVFAGVLGVIFGLVGRSQTRRTGQRGTTMATFGACLGAAWLVLFGGAIVWAVLNEAERDDTGTVVAEGDESAFELAVGDCLRTIDEGAQVESVPLVPCAEPHDGEVYDAFALPDGGYPGDEAIATAAETGCIDRFQTFVGAPYEDSVLELFFYNPTRRSWALADDREVVCVIQSDATTGSARDTAA